MTYREAITFGEQSLEEAGIAEAKNDAWLLLARVCQIDRTYYYVHMAEDMPQKQQESYELFIRKRAERVPLQYITGEQEFMGLQFLVNQNVLIPRQDTETLVEQALKLAEPGMHILDMCTGSGCILISILSRTEGAVGVGCDISGPALLVAKENARLNRVSAVFRESDLFENVTEQFDMIVSNPPYIRSEEIAGLMPEVAQYEPIGALDGKEDGLYFYRKIVQDSREHLKFGGCLLFEIGYDQAEAVSDMLNTAGYIEIQVIQDLTGKDRVVIGKWNPI